MRGLAAGGERKPFAPAALRMLINECLAKDQSRFANAVQAR